MAKQTQLKNFRFDSDTVQKLEEICKWQERNMTDEIRWLITRRWEEYQRAKLDPQIINQAETITQS